MEFYRRNPSLQLRAIRTCAHNPNVLHAYVKVAIPPYSSGNSDAAPTPHTATSPFQVSRNPSLQLRAIALFLTQRLSKSVRSRIHRLSTCKTRNGVVLLRGIRRERGWFCWPRRTRWASGRSRTTSPRRRRPTGARLVLEFAHHVDDILVFLRDVLMPRKLRITNPKTSYRRGIVVPPSSFPIPRPPGASSTLGRTLLGGDLKADVKIQN
jgi:hypothetical protein